VVAPKKQAAEGVSTDEGDETKQRVLELADILRARSPINLYHFLINPDDFGQTIENWFHFSFLIKDGRARVVQADDGSLIAGVLVHCAATPRSLSLSLCVCVMLVC
jgi:hypothetical protein